MANTIALAQKYLPLLDEVYKASSRTAILDATKVDILNGNTIKVFKTSMDGLGNYNRNTGFTNGDVTGTCQDRGGGRQSGGHFHLGRYSESGAFGHCEGHPARRYSAGGQSQRIWHSPV